MLADKLRARGIILAQPASGTALSALKSLVPADVFDALYKNIYQWFDGFANDDFDEESFLRIWPIERLVKSRYLSSRFVPFADFSLDGEIYGLATGRVPEILCLHSNKAASIEIDNLVTALADGEFDNTLGI